METIIGGDPQDNAQITRDVLDGKQSPCFDAVVMNAGAGIYIGGKAKTLKEGMEKAREILLSKQAKTKLEEFIKETNA